jgi:hypothetical protein
MLIKVFAVVHRDAVIRRQQILQQLDHGAAASGVCECWFRSFGIQGAATGLTHGYCSLGRSVARGWQGFGRLQFDTPQAQFVARHKSGVKVTAHGAHQAVRFDP